MPASRIKKELPSFIAIKNYLSKFLPLTAEVCEPLHKGMSMKSKWGLKNTYQNLYKKAGALMKKDMSIVFLQCKRTTIPRKRCNGCWTQRNSSASKGSNAVPKEWSTQQHGIATNSIKSLTSAEHATVTSRESLGILYSVKKVPPLLLHSWG